MHRPFLFKFQDIEGTGIFTGRASVFNVKDHGGDIVKPGAFKASLSQQKAAGRMPAFLAHHDAKTPIGVWTEVEEQGDALVVMGKFALETTAGREAYSLAKMGALDGLSIGYAIPEGGAHFDRNTQANILTKLQLWEISLVTFPMNEAARVDRIKSTEAPKRGADNSTMLLHLAQL